MKWPALLSRARLIPRLSILAALSLTACDGSRQSLKRANMTPLSPRLTLLFEKTKTVCFSHFVVEVPASATVVYGPAWVDADIEYYPAEADRLAEHVEKTLVEVAADRKYLDAAEIAEFPMYGKTIDGVVPGQKLVFGSKNQATYSIHSFIPVGKDLFVQRRNSVVEKAEAVNSMNAVAGNLHQRAEDEVPSEPGTCIDGGFVTWQAEFEKVTVGIRLAEFPDVHFSIEALKNQKYLVESSELETRLQHAEKDTPGWHSRITLFRRGPRQIGDWKGSEALALKPADKDVEAAHEFHFISLGAINAPLQPQLDVQLDTGADGHHMGRVKPSLTNEEAVALWDKLTNSIRVRPLGGKQSSAADARKTPLASLVRTGGVCPQTGWWQCAEANAIDGGQPRHITEGESMPHAIIKGAPNLWHKLTGNRPTQTLATVWKLVDYDTAPTAPPAAS